MAAWNHDIRVSTLPAMLLLLLPLQTLGCSTARIITGTQRSCASQQLLLLCDLGTALVMQQSWLMAGTAALCACFGAR